MIDALSLKAKGYKGAYPDFPDQSTADQFFDEEQFEAYRELGYRSVVELLSKATTSAQMTTGPGISELLRDA